MTTVVISLIDSMRNTHYQKNALYTQASWNRPHGIISISIENEDGQKMDILFFEKKYVSSSYFSI